MKNLYSNLLSPARFRLSTIQDRDIVSESDSDRGRLLFCAAFRRLQQKAQVFSLESNAAVRSRLTHSLEVAQIGKYIAETISSKLLKEDLIEIDQGRAIVNFVETACLMHDIGNPPFGHFGEAAIREWFLENGKHLIFKACNIKDSLPSSAEKFIADFEQFDGNPQGFRIVTRLQRNSDEFGLNLTKTTLATYLKYIRCSTEPKGSANPFTKKCGFFFTEKDLVTSIWKEFNCELSPRRFALTYVMEAADDIAYCISDLEDSIEKRLLEQEKAFREIFDAWKKETEHLENKLNIEKILQEYQDSEAATYTGFRTKLTNHLVDYSANQYIQQHEKILSGSSPSLIPDTSAEGKILETLKKYCREHVYNHESVQKTELAGYAAIYGLLNCFKCLLECSSEDFNTYLNDSTNNAKKITPKKLLILFPPRHKKTYQHHITTLDSNDPDFSFKEWNFRAHLVVDFIAGMTDNFAMNTFRELSGIQP